MNLSTFAHPFTTTSRLTILTNAHRAALDQRRMRQIGGYLDRRWLTATLKSRGFARTDEIIPLIVLLVLPPRLL